MKKTMSLLLLAGLLSSGAAVAQTASADLNGDAMRAWIMENPQVLIDSLQKYEADQQARQLQDLSDKVESLRAELADGSPVIGNPAGTFEIIMFSDYLCPHCKNTHAALERVLVDQPDVKVMVRELPILGQNSVTAARYALAVNAIAGQEAYAAVNTRIFDAGASVDEVWVRSDITSAGLDAAAVLAAMMSPEVDAHLSKSLSLAQDLGVTGTPFLVVGKQAVPGGLGLDGFNQVIAEQRALP